MVAFVMNQLERLLALVQKTGLPTIIPGNDGRDDCVLLPLEEYERVVGGLSHHLTASVAPVQVAQAFKEEARISLEAFQEPPVPEVSVDQPSISALSLQDLLRPRTDLDPVSTPTSTQSSISPQASSLEDRFVFDGPETKILPQTRQKSSIESSALDEFGQTLA